MSRKVALLKGHLSNSGGLEKWTFRLADAFSKRGCDVKVLTTGVVNPQDYPFEVVSLAERSKWSYRQLLRFDRRCKQWLKENPQDIVFGLDRNSEQTHYRAGNGVHAEYLKRRCENESCWKRWSFSLNPLHRSILRIEKTAFESPELQALFTNSAMVRNEILSHYKVRGSKIHVVHNGVEWDEMAPDFQAWPEQKTEILQSLSLPNDCFHFLFIGNGYQRKGLSYLLEGLGRLAYRDFHLSVIGKDREQGRFEQMVQDLGLRGKVSFFGQRKDVRRFYQVADALAIPSTYDPFANVTVEALAMGLHVLSSEFNGGSEVLTPENGTIVEELYEVGSMAQALEETLDRTKTPKSAERIRTSIQHLSFDTQLNRIIDHSL